MQIDKNILTLVGEMHMPLMDLPRRMSVLRLAEQACPWHGISSQDPAPAAQVALAFEEAEREVKSVTTGSGMVGGVAGGMVLPRGRP